MKTKLLVGISGSFCNHERVLEELMKLKDDYDITFVFTKNVSTLDTRFFSAIDLEKKCREISSSNIIVDLNEAEKVGPSSYFDIMAIIPCTAHTLFKLVYGAYDCPVALCAKAMVRNLKNIVIGISSNDILGVSGVNLMKCINMKHFYVLPFFQDDPIIKQKSVTSDFSLLSETLIKALNNQQIQPILKEKK
ncbi:MAG: dipicolinate synthase subunit B [Traorella sp.]